MTCCPRYFLLTILGACVDAHRFQRLVFFYSEGTYNQAGETPIFTNGDWEPVSVPFFHGVLHPERYRHFLVSAGFEGSRVLRMVTKYEPDRVSVLLPYPGMTDEYSLLARRENQDLIDEYCVPRKQVVEVSAADAVAVWKNLDNPVLYSVSESTAALAFGPKPHTLGLGLYALTHPDIQVLYCKPSSFARKDVRATGRNWVYEIRSLNVI